MSVHIEEIVLRAHIKDGSADLPYQDDAQNADSVDEDRDDLLRRMILDDCARMIRDALNRRMGR